MITYDHRISGVDKGGLWGKAKWIRISEFNVDGVKLSQYTKCRVIEDTLNASGLHKHTTHMHNHPFTCMWA